jgi:hypothetical protein
MLELRTADPAFEIYFYSVGMVIDWQSDARSVVVTDIHYPTGRMFVEPYWQRPYKPSVLDRLRARWRNWREVAHA